METYHEKEFSILAAIEKGRKLPDWADDEPHLEPSEIWLLSAYFDLSTCRGVDGAIPWRDMVEYADRAGLEPDVSQAFVRIMRSVDSEKLARDRSKSAAKDRGGSIPIHDEQPDTSPGISVASKEAMLAAARRRAQNVKKV